MKYFYTYTIIFDDGYYYHGSKCSTYPPKECPYMGSPVTNAEKWNNTPYHKIIENEFSNHNDMKEAEHNLIGNKHRTDEYCLNAHNTRTFGCFGLNWYYCKDEYGNIKEKLSKQPLDGWHLGRPTINSKIPKESRLIVSLKLKGRTRSIQHAKRISESKKGTKTGNDNVMSDPNVKYKHQCIMKSDNYRKSVSNGVRKSDRWTDTKKKEHRERMRKKLLDNNPSSKKILYMNKEYNSIVAAIRDTGHTRKRIKKHCEFLS